MKKTLGMLKKRSLIVMSAIALFAAVYSSTACFLFALHQRKCPESLIKKDE